MTRGFFLAVPVLALGALAGCRAAGPWLRGAPGKEEIRLLHEKAAVFQTRLEERHLSPEGLLVYRRSRPLGATGWPDLASSTASYGPQSDGGIWTGCYLAAESLRYGATLDPAALEQVRRVVQGLELLSEVTGRAGLYGRTFEPTGLPVPGTDPPDVWRPATGGLPAYRYRGDLSKDQVSGIVFGLATAYATVDDPEVLASCRRQLTRLADHILAHGFRIVDVDGFTTSHGDLDLTMLGFLPKGVNALIALAVCKAAHHATGEARYARAYEDLVRRGALHHAVFSKVELLGTTKHSNDVMAFLSLYTLLRLETDRGFRGELVEGVHRSLRWVGSERNSLFNAIVCAYVARDPLLLEDAVSSLVEFPLETRALPVDLRDRTDIRRRLFFGCKGYLCSVAALPLDLRQSSSFTWKSCPHSLVRPGPVGEEVFYSGCDFLIAYWLLRYHGLLPHPTTGGQR
jgi:hypothetical protein